MKEPSKRTPKAALHQTVRHLATARLTLGLSRAAIDYLRHASECVSSDDLTDGRTPWCYERVDDMAHLLGVDPRSVHNIERRLHELGLVERKPMANGHRWAKRCRKTGEILWVHGVSLAPLIARRDELAALATRVADRDRAFRSTRQQVHGLRARLKETLAVAAEFSALAELRDRTWAIYDAAPARVTRYIFDLEDLARIRAELTLALDALVEAVQVVETDALDAVNNGSNSDEISDAAEIEAIHKYGTTPINLYSCNNAEPPNGGKIPYFKDRANARSRLEIKCAGGETAHNPKNRAGGKKSPSGDAPVLTARQLLDLAPDRWRDALDGIETVDWSVIGYVAAARRAELGVSDHAWRGGIERMGERRAAICLAVLDINRDHPTKPVRSVGGAFVAMTRRAEAGDLHLEPSIQWIAARKAGVEPRADA